MYDHGPSFMSLDSLGRYEILEELGRGAMGVVYKARDPLIDRTVAIKTVDLDSSPDRTEASFERRFYREAKSAGQLNHLNIVTIHDVGRSGGSAYIAMEFLEGKSLREIIDSGVVLPPEKIAEIVAQAAEGLACAHKNHVIHRDIKPANIMLLDSGTVKITDFGIALLSKGSLTLGSVFGSPKYISPEQVVGHQADARSDIFSLGAVLYELLTGSPAFTASDLDAVLCQVINEIPAAPSTRNRNIAPGFDRITARAMAKHPDDRYPSAQEMADDLRNFQDLEAPADVQVSQRTLERRLRWRDAAKARFGAEAADRQVERFSSPVANAVWRQAQHDCHRSAGGPAGRRCGLGPGAEIFAEARAARAESSRIGSFAGRSNESRRPAFARGTARSIASFDTCGRGEQYSPGPCACGSARIRGEPVGRSLRRR